MAKGINKAIIVGNLGRDPEVRYSPDGRAVTSIAVATTEKWKDKNTGELQEATEWHRVVGFGRLAEVMGEWLKKGQQVYIEGKIQTRTYEKEGQTHYSTQIVAKELLMLGGGNGTDQQQKPAQQPVQAATPAANHPDAVPGNNMPDFDDDVPF